MAETWLQTGFRLFFRALLLMNSWNLCIHAQAPPAVDHAIFLSLSSSMQIVQSSLALLSILSWQALLHEGVFFLVFDCYALACLFQQLAPNGIMRSLLQLIVR
jgi:hypothetical protein